MLTIRLTSQLEYYDALQESRIQISEYETLRVISSAQQQRNYEEQNVINEKLPSVPVVKDDAEEQVAEEVTYFLVS